VTAARSGRVLETMGAPALSAPRVCALCGASLAGKRRHARFCGSGCRATAARGEIDGRGFWRRHATVRRPGREGRGEALRSAVRSSTEPEAA